MNIRNSRLVLFLLLVLCGPVHAAILCDQLNDTIDSAVAGSNFLTASTGTIMLWYMPVGAAPTGDTECFGGEDVVVIGKNVHWMGIHRNGTLGGTTDAICAYSWDSNEDSFGATYTVDVWTHLAWVHSGGNLSMYKDGVLVNTIAAGNTADLTENVSLCGGGGTSDPAGGYLADVSIESTALSASLIASIAGARTHRTRATQPNANWTFAQCAVGASGNAVVFQDHSGNGRTITGNDGSGATSLLCQGSNFLSYPWGVE